MALQRHYAGDDWLRVAQVAGIGFVESPSSGCTSLAAGFSRAGDEWSPTAFSGSNG